MERDQVHVAVVERHLVRHLELFADDVLGGLARPEGELEPVVPRQLLLRLPLRQLVLRLFRVVEPEDVVLLRVVPELVGRLQDLEVRQRHDPVGQHGLVDVPADAVLDRFDRDARLDRVRHELPLPRLQAPGEEPLADAGAPVEDGDGAPFERQVGVVLQQGRVGRLGGDVAPVVQDPVPLHLLPEDRDERRLAAGDRDRLLPLVGEQLADLHPLREGRHGGVRDRGHRTGWGRPGGRVGHFHRRHGGLGRHRHPPRAAAGDSGRRLFLAGGERIRLHCGIGIPRPLLQGVERDEPRRGPGRRLHLGTAEVVGGVEVHRE